jgi:heme-degrading monooxygenase HmoA
LNAHRVLLQPGARDSRGAEERHSVLHTKMFLTVWEYRVNADRIEDFLDSYDENGTWVSLFRRGLGYLGTSLLRDLIDPARFITIDRWNTRTSYQEFKDRFAHEYATLDEACQEMTVSETPLGYFESGDQSQPD